MPACRTADDPGPAAGGRVVISLASEPTNLDAGAATSLYDAMVLYRTGSWLVQRTPEGGLVPYLAERWQVSEDGLTYTFRLVSGVRFHNGDLLTAGDYAWTLQRAIDLNGAAAFALGNVDTIRALDDLTLEIRLKDPYAPFETMLAAFGPYLQPLSRRAVEEAGEGYSRSPVGVGPFRFSSWTPGEAILLERNPDFNWGPAFAQDGPPLVAELQFRIIPDDSIRVAAIESGEIHIGYDIQPKDIRLLEERGGFQFLTVPFTGLDPFIAINQDVPALRSLEVRQALNLAVDRDALVQIVLQGRGAPQYGPVSPAVIGYWPGVEEIGYRFDSGRAEALLQRAGYVRNVDGIFEDENGPLQFSLLTSNIKGYEVLAAALVEMWARIGVRVEVELVESGVLRQRVRFDRDYELGVGHIGNPDIDMLYQILSSDALYTGIAVSDPVLDELLLQSRTTLDPEMRAGVARQVQEYITAQAYLIPLYYSEVTIPVRPELAGVSVNAHHDIFLFDAYFQAP